MILAAGLPFAKELTHMIGRLHGVPWLHHAPTSKVSPSDARTMLVLGLVEIVSVAAIVRNSIAVSQQSAAIVGISAGVITALLALVLPRVLIPPLLDATCARCPPLARTSIGVLLLLALMACDGVSRWGLTYSGANGADRASSKRANARKDC